MTTPVFMTGRSENVAKISFVMPDDMSLDKVPQPSNGSVTVR